MSSGIIAIMIGVSTFLGVIGLFGVRHDGEDELRDAAELEKKREEAVKRHKEKNYQPPD